MPHIEQELSQLKEQGLFRTLEAVEGIDFASNDYLGLSRSEKIRFQLLEIIQTEKSLGSSGSRLVSGNTRATEETEAFIAETFGTETSLFFGSGYLANLGVVTALGGESTEFFSDALNHASLIDGIRLSKSSFQVFKHNDTHHLEQLLKQSQSSRKVILTESIFSMDGDQAPVQEFAKLAERYDAYLVLDEAHATGTTGESGLGLAHALPGNRQISVHTCGKALGGYGAFICCSRLIKELLINKARSFIFSTALPPWVVAQTRIALTEILTDSRHYLALQKNIADSLELFQKYHFTHSGTHIVPHIVGKSSEALSLAQKLQKRGIFVKAIRFPSVPENTARLRITLKAFHTHADLELLCKSLQEFRTQEQI